MKNLLVMNQWKTISSISFTHKSNEADGDSESDVEQEEKPFSQQPFKYQTLHCCICWRFWEYFPTLPKDPRTLLHTQVTWCVRYSRKTVLSLWYFIKLITESWTTLVFIGWWILLLASNKYWLFLLRVQVISSEQYWGKTNLFDKTPFIIRLFSGQSKPSNLNNYLRKFVNEYKELNENGFDINGKHFNMQINSAICDANDFSRD